MVDVPWFPQVFHGDVQPVDLFVWCGVALAPSTRPSVQPRDRRSVWRSDTIDRYIPTMMQMSRIAAWTCLMLWFSWPKLNTDMYVYHIVIYIYTIYLSICMHILYAEKCTDYLACPEIKGTAWDQGRGRHRCGRSQKNYGGTLVLVLFVV